MQRIDKEADQLVAVGADMKNNLKARIKQKGHTTKNHLLVERVETIFEQRPR